MVRNYFGVNEHLQSLNYPNVFAGGDCITIDKYVNFPPKAGVYAVREGPFIGQNIVNYIKGEPFLTYVP